MIIFILTVILIALLSVRHDAFILGGLYLLLTYAAILFDIVAIITYILLSLISPSSSKLILLILPCAACWFVLKMIWSAKNGIPHVLENTDFDLEIPIRPEVMSLNEKRKHQRMGESKHSEKEVRQSFDIIASKDQNQQCSYNVYRSRSKLTTS